MYYLLFNALHCKPYIVNSAWSGCSMGEMNYFCNIVIN